MSGINSNSPTVSGSYGLLNDPLNFNLQSNPFTTSQICAGVSTLQWKKLITLDAYYLPCSQFKDYTTCNSFSNCNYSYSSFLFINTSGCDGIFQDDGTLDTVDFKVNLSIYNFPGSLDLNSSLAHYGLYTAHISGFCDSTNATRLGNRLTCELFGCTWINATERLGTAMNSIEKSVNPITMWQTLKWIVSFQFDFGFDSFTNLIINFILAVLLPLALFMALYFMFIPG